MTTERKKARVDLEGGDSVTVEVSLPREQPPKPRPGIILAHGAGNDMSQPLLVYLADRLARAGYVSARFNFPYKERGKKAPDKRDKLERTWLSVCEYMLGRAEFRLSALVAAGKSMGGRIASHLAAEGRLPAERMIFLGYPLHPPGKKDRLRDEHLYRIRMPMLFFAGTRDPLCGLDLLRPVLSRLNAPWNLHIIDGGDHSFKVLKSSPQTQDEVYSSIFEEIVLWIEGDSP